MKRYLPHLLLLALLGFSWERAGGWRRVVVERQHPLVGEIEALLALGADQELGGEDLEHRLDQYRLRAAAWQDEASLSQGQAVPPGPLRDQLKAAGIDPAKLGAWLQADPGPKALAVRSYLSMWTKTTLEGLVWNGLACSLLPREAVQAEFEVRGPLSSLLPLVERFLRPLPGARWIPVPHLVRLQRGPGGLHLTCRLELEPLEAVE